jgi:ubiquinone/menaquinone biosynthesis C-methylase UbiE
MDYTSKKYANLLQEDKRHVQEVIKYLHPRPEDTILEIGCSRGFLTRAIQSIAPNTYGVDINSEAIRNGVTRNLSVMSGEHLTFYKETFDKVYSFHTIEHILDIHRVLKEIERVLKPGGSVLLVYPAEPIRGLFALRSALFMFKNPFKAGKIHVHRFAPKKIKELVYKTGLEYVRSEFTLLSIPQFFTLLQKKV